MDVGPLNLAAEVGPCMRSLRILTVIASIGLLGSCADGSDDATGDDPRLVVALSAPRGRTEPTTSLQARSIPTTAAPTSTATSATTLPLPKPLSIPVGEGEPGPRLGRLVIPRLGANIDLYSGVNPATLNLGGAGHWPGSALPGKVGNVVVAAHRVSHGGPFRRIDQLAVGDEVRFEADELTVTYLVSDTEIVEPSRLDIIAQTPEYTATLFACHPPGSTKFRYVVKLRLAGT